MIDLERQMFRKVSVWVVGVILIFAFVGTILFGTIAVHVERGGRKAGILGTAVHALSTFPQTIDRLDNGTNYLRVREPVHEGKAGFAFSYPAGSRPDAGYLLLSRYDGDKSRPVVEYWDLNTQTIVHSWMPETDAMFAKANFTSSETVLLRDKNEHRLLIRHPIITDDGGLLIKSRTPLLKVDACGRFVWMIDSHLFHHSLERDGEGNYWTAVVQEPPTVAHVDRHNFLDDSLAQVSPNGKLLFVRSVSQILVDNGLRRIVYGHATYEPNPIHLNDIEPVMADGPHWKKGDLFLSLRSPSMVILYRPSTNKIIWSQSGPWLHQHDVDILDEHRISVFDNASFEYFPIRRVEDHSNVLVRDFDTGQVTAPWATLLKAVQLRTETEGLHTVRERGALFVEEQNYGRLLEFSPDGRIDWEYVNRAKDGYIYRVGWSRILEADYGRNFAQILAAARCE